MNLDLPWEEEEGEGGDLDLPWAWMALTAAYICLFARLC